MIDSLRRLLTERNLKMAFQPIWDLRTNAVLGYEALARPSPEYGFSGPDEIFRLAHGSRLVHELDALCFEAIARATPRIPDGVLLFANVSPATLEHPEFQPERLALGIQRRGFDPSRVVVEVTEREITHLDRVVERASRLRECGMKIALDDTGSGNAGLWVLSMLPIDFLKIDRSIILRALTDRPSRAVLAGIAAIARETGAALIAEGIDSDAMLQFVYTHHAQNVALPGDIHAVQGYLIAQPQLAGIPHDPKHLGQRVALALVG